jgi:hypothetical protein
MRRNFNPNWTIVCLTLLLAIISLSWEGCPMLIVPSLAYQGYKYEKGQNSSTANTTHKTSSPANKSHSPANQSVNDDSIE